MIKLHNIIVPLLLLVSSAVMADNFAYLSIVHTDGQTDFSISSIQKITFSDGNMVINLSDGTEQKLPMTSLSRMFFSTNGTDGVSVLENQNSTFQLKEGMLKILSPKGDFINIYDMNGRVVRSVPVHSEETSIDLKGLEKGVYIVRTKSESRKFENK